MKHFPHEKAPTSHHVLIEIEFPTDLEQFRLPVDVQQRLQALPDRQDQGNNLTPTERQEAKGLVELAEMLSLLQLHVRRAV